MKQFTKKTEFKKQSERSSNGKRGFEGRTSEGRGFEGRSGEGRSFEGRSGEGRSFEGRSGESRSFEGRTGEGRGFKAKTGESRTFKPKTGESRTFKPKTGESRTFKPKTGENRGFKPRTGEYKGFKPREDREPREDRRQRDDRDPREDRRQRDDRTPRDERYTKENIIKETAIKETEKVNDRFREDLIEGRNAVIEALRGEKTTIEQILVAIGDTKGSINVVLGLAKERGIVVKEVERKKLDSMTQTGAHQGVMAIITPYTYHDVQDILDYAAEKEEKPFIIILDELEDPHNFGAIIRTAEICGAHGIIIPKRRNVGVTPTVYKASAGAIEHMRIAKVTNVNAVIDELKKVGIWIYGADMDAKNYCYETNLGGAVAMVIGSEGRGISKLTKDKCDVLVKIPMVGKITSLNASVAGGILMYEVLKQKMSKPKK